MTKRKAGRKKNLAPSPSSSVSRFVESLDQAAAAIGRATPGGSSAEPFAPREWLGPALIASFAWIIYLLTLYPSMPGGDSGELISVAHTSGVPHPPGYPLFTLLLKAFLWLPFQSVAWRANLANSLMSATAVFWFGWAIRRWTRSGAAAIAGAGMFALSPLVWTYSVGAEVFALNNLCVSVLLFLAVSFARDPRPRTLWIAFFVSGLSLTNHHTSLFPVTFFVGWMSLSQYSPFFGGRGIELDRFQWRRAALAWALFFAALLPYLYLPWAAGHPDGKSWGDPSSWDGFLTHVLRKEYGTFQLAKHTFGKATQFWDLFGLFTQNLFTESLFIGPVFAGLGLWVTYRKRDDGPRLPWAVLGAAIAYLCFFHSLTNLNINTPLYLGVVRRFWQQANLFFYFFGAIGFATAFAWIGNRFATRPLAQWAPLAAAVSLVVVQAATHYRAVDQSANSNFAAYGRAMLQPLPPNAILLVKGDLISNSVHYLQYCEGVRPDVRILDMEIMTYPWFRKFLRPSFANVTIPGTHYHPFEPGGFSLKMFLDENSPRAPVFVAGGFKDGDTSFQTDYVTEPFGFIERIVPKRLARSPLEWADESRRMLTQHSGLDLGHLQGANPESWERIVWQDYWESRHRIAYRLLELGIKNGGSPDLLRGAVAAYQDLVQSHPEPEPYYFKNLGIAYSKLAPGDPSAAEPMKSAWRKYASFNPTRDPELPAILQQIK